MPRIKLTKKRLPSNVATIVRLTPSERDAHKKRKKKVVKLKKTLKNIVKTGRKVLKKKK